MSLDPQAYYFATSNLVYVPPALRDEMDGYKPPWIDRTGHQDSTSSGAMNLARVPDGWSPDTMISARSDVLEKYQPFPGSCGLGRKDEPAERNPKYHYMPMESDSSGEIRMLCLLPGRKEDPILARIEPCSLDNTPSYEAISYAWGDPHSNAFIVVRDGYSDYSIRVPQSLHRALTQLRHHVRPRYIWADAVCIDQQNEKEKSQQVQLMPLVYRKAVRVLIWLGDESVDTGALFNLISRIYARDFKAVPPLDNKEIWAGLKALFTRPWFWRVWCLQEAVLAPSAEVILGQHSIPWDHVGFAATWIRCMPLGVFQKDRALIGVYNACLTYSLSNGYKDQQRMSILQLLTLTRAFRATDARDKVYAVLGIPTAQSDPDAGNIFIQPDYTKTTSEVYIDCALAIIRHTRSLQLLSYVQHGEIQEWSTAIRIGDNDNSLTKVPSWVPRWHHYFSRTLAPAEQETQTFRASGSIDFGADANTTIEGVTILTPGIRLSLVQATSSVFSNLHTASVNIQDTANVIFTEFEKPLRDADARLIDILYTLSITLTAGKNWFGSIVEDKEQHLADFLAVLDNKPLSIDHLQFGDLEERNAYLHQRMRENAHTQCTSSLSQPFNMTLVTPVDPEIDITLESAENMSQYHCPREYTRSKSYLHQYTQYLSSLTQPPNTLHSFFS